MTELIEHGIHVLVAPQLARDDALLFQRVLWRDGWPLRKDSMACMLDKGEQLDFLISGNQAHGKTVRNV